MKKPSLLLTLRVNNVEEPQKPISVEEEVEQEIVSRIIYCQITLTTKEREIQRLSLSASPLDRSSSKIKPIIEHTTEKTNEDQDRIIYFTEDPYRVYKTKVEADTKHKAQQRSSKEDIGNLKSVLLNQFELTTVLSNQLTELKKKKR